MMCSPICAGGAAAILCSPEWAAWFTTTPIGVKASVVGSGKIGDDLDDTLTERLAAKAFEAAGVGVEEIDVIEVHDATSPSEIITLIELGICRGRDAAKWVHEGYLEVDRRMPSNTSAGLVSKGHPIGATDAGQIHEIVQQLRGTAGRRRVKDAKIGMTHNGGGILGIDAAAMAIHIFKR